MADVHGRCDQRFDAVREVFAGNLDSGLDVGASVAIVLDGEPEGYLVGEVVRRVTGESLGTFLAKEVAGPIGADFHVGIGPEHFHRIANVIPPPPLELPPDPDPIALRTLGNPPLNAEWAWTDIWRRAESPAANGQGNARSVAAIQTPLA